MVRSCSLDILLMPANRQNQMRDLDKTQHQQNWWEKKVLHTGTGKPYSQSKNRMQRGLN
jgi:hypothetical protein